MQFDDMGTSVEAYNQFPNNPAPLSIAFFSITSNNTEKLSYGAMVITCAYPPPSSSDSKQSALIVSSVTGSGMASQI